MKRISLRVLIAALALILGSLATVDVQAAGRPGSFALRTPAAAATVTTNTPWFSWDSASGVTSYRLQIRNANGTVIASKVYTPTQAACAGDSVCSVVTPYRFPNGWFSWRVIAWNSAGNTFTNYRSINVRVPTQPVEAQQILALVNQKRCDAGLVPLVLDSRLLTAARTHSSRMIQFDFFAHDDPENNTDPGDRIRAAGYPATGWGENIAAGYTSVQAAFNAWWNSSGHRANILRSYFREMGLGYVRGGDYGHYWTQTFGTRSGATGGRCP